MTTPAPGVFSVSPFSGSVGGGDTVTLTGNYFTGATSVFFGSVSVDTFTVVNDNTITLTSMPGSEGAVQVTVTTPSGTSTQPLTYTYTSAPTITSITPVTGTTAGLTPLQINGTGFSVNSITRVLVGGIPATGVNVITPNQLNCVVPTHMEGVVDIKVINPDTQSFILPGAYTYTQFDMGDYWRPDLLEIIEESYERAGIEVRTGYQLRSARRSLNILFADLANRGYNMWTVVQDTIPLVTGQIEYALPSDTVDVLEQVIRQYPGSPNQVDLQISRISVSTYANIPTKTNTGRPIQIYYDRLTPVPTARIWPAPNQAGYYLNYWRMARVADVGKTGIGTTDSLIPYRFIPAIIAGLSYYLSIKSTGFSDRGPMLKQMYDEAWQRAIEEDRDRSPVRFVPHIGVTGGYGGGW